MRHFYIFILINCLSTNGWAQQEAVAQSSSLDSSLKRRLYYGKEYYIPPVNINGTRSFMDFNFVDDATVVYEGVLYEEVMLMYDIVRDEVVIRDIDLALNTCLIRQFITSFSLNGYEFLQVFDETEGLTPGFYYKVYDSENFTAYGVRNKSIQEYTSGTIRERRVNERLNMFFKSKDDSTFVPITGSRNFLRNFGSNRKEVDRYMRGQDVLYRDDPEGYVQSVLRFVDETKER